MCGRYVLDDPQQIFHHYSTTNTLDLQPNFNVTPGQSMPVIIQDSTGHNQARLMRWGLIPYWAKDPRIGYRLINARCETVTSKPSFSDRIHHHRCLVPATGFYEWDQHHTPKTPHYFHLPEHPLYSFAGLYASWPDSVGKPLFSFTILTMPANDQVLPIHHRMPAILQSHYESLWLNPHTDISASLSELLQPYPSTTLQHYPVSHLVNHPQHNSPQLTQPLHAS
jgi:putative SOS response-associated peptidase YedK